MNEHLRAVQDKAWDLKEVCDDLAPRKLSERDQATLQSVLRDLDRLQQKLVGIRDKRKRSAEAPESDPAPQQQLDVDVEGQEDAYRG